MLFNSKLFSINKRKFSTKPISTLGTIILLSIGAVSVAQANTISGRISLPSGVVAPSGGLSITITSQLIDDFGFGRDTVTIAAGRSSTNYSLRFSDDSDRRIVFECNDCAKIDVTTQGGWSNDDGVVGDFVAQRFLGTQNHIVNILLEAADTFTGTVSLPLDLTATGDEFLFMEVRNTDGLILGLFSDSEALSPGQTSFDFAVGVATDITDIGWQIRFMCIRCDDRIESQSHFATSANGGVPSLERSSAFEFRRNVDFSGINLTLIDNQPAQDPRSERQNTIIAPIFLLLDDE